MKLLPQTKKDEILGIDINDLFVEILSLNQTQQKIFIDAFAHAALPETAILETEIKEIKTITTALEKVLKLSKTSKRKAAIALPDSSVMTRIITMEKGLSELELEEYILLEIDKHIPYSIDEIYVDYQIIDENEDRAQNQILIAATQRKIIDAYSKALLNAGLELVLVDIKSLAMQKACEFCIKGLANRKTNVVVNLSNNNMTVLVYQNNIPVFTRTELYSCGALTQNILIQDYRNIKAKKKSDSILSESLKESICRDIKHSLGLYASTIESFEVKKIILAGNVTVCSDLNEMIQKEFNVITEFANPLLQLGIGKKVIVDELIHKSKSLMLTFGLAIRGMDG